MSYLADAHRDWHTVNGRWGCPLDCAESDPMFDPMIGEDYGYPADDRAYDEGPEHTTYDLTASMIGEPPIEIVFREGDLSGEPPF